MPMLDRFSTARRVTAARPVFAAVRRHSTATGAELGVGAICTLLVASGVMYSLFTRQLHDWARESFNRRLDAAARRTPALAEWERQQKSGASTSSSWCD